MWRLTRPLAAALALMGSGALAGPNDFVLTHLGGRNRPAGELPVAAVASAEFRAFARSMGAAFTAANLAPAETLGHSAFAAAMELSVLSLDTTRLNVPTQDPLTGPLLLPSLHVRKGLPFSLELGARVGWVDRSRMFTATAELKGALFEGFAYLPDLSVRGYATRLFGARDLGLTTGGLDLSVGKQFAIGGMATVTPYGGFNPGFTGASTRPLDYGGGDPSAPGTAVLEHSATLQDVRFFENSHQRFYGGVRFISGVVQLGAEVSFTAIPGFTQDGIQSSPPSLLAFNAMLGLDF